MMENIVNDITNDIVNGIVINITNNISDEILQNFAPHMPLNIGFFSKKTGQLCRKQSSLMAGHS